MNIILDSFDANVAEDLQLRYKYVTSGYQLLSDADLLDESVPAGVSASELSLRLEKTVIEVSQVSLTSVYMIVFKHTLTAGYARMYDSHCFCQKYSMRCVLRRFRFSH